MKLNRICTLLAGCLLFPAAITQAAGTANPQKGEIGVTVRVNVFVPACSLASNQRVDVPLGEISRNAFSNGNKPTGYRTFRIPFECKGGNNGRNMYIRVNGDATNNELLNLYSLDGDAGLARLLKVRIYGGTGKNNPLKIFAPTASNISMQDEVSDSRRTGSALPFSAVADAWTSGLVHNTSDTRGFLELGAELVCRGSQAECDNLPGGGRVAGSAFITMEYF